MMNRGWLSADLVIQIRLTFNYWRKGGYGVGHEDYRWYGKTCLLLVKARADELGREIVRRQVPKAVFHVFNWTFISFYQCILLYLISAPIYTILLASTIEPNVTSGDLASLAIQLGLILTEYIADEQQWGTQATPIPRRPQLKTLTQLSPTCSLPDRKEAIPVLGQGPTGLQAGRPRPRLHRLGPLGVQPAPQLRGGAVHLVRAVPVELLRDQDGVQLGRARPRAAHHALPGLDLADRAHHGGQVRRVRRLPAQRGHVRARALLGVRDARAPGAQDHPHQRARQEAAAEGAGEGEAGEAEVK